MPAQERGRPDPETSKNGQLKRRSPESAQNTDNLPELELSLIDTDYRLGQRIEAFNDQGELETFEITQLDEATGNVVLAELSEKRGAVPGLKLMHKAELALDESLTRIMVAANEHWDEVVDGYARTENVPGTVTGFKVKAEMYKYKVLSKLALDILHNHSELKTALTPDQLKVQLDHHFAEVLESEANEQSKNPQLNAAAKLEAIVGYGTALSELANPTPKSSEPNRSQNLIAARYQLYKSGVESFQPEIHDLVPETLMYSLGRIAKLEAARKEGWEKFREDLARVDKFLAMDDLNTKELSSLEDHLRTEFANLNDLDFQLLIAKKEQGQKHTLAASSEELEGHARKLQSIRDQLEKMGEEEENTGRLEITAKKPKARASKPKVKELAPTPSIDNLLKSYEAENIKPPSKVAKALNGVTQGIKGILSNLGL